MIYLTTGANGAGKTLITLRDVRAQQLKENRPVYYHGFEMDPAKEAEFGWQKFDPKEWQSLPDGSICIMDECQNEFPIRRSGAPVPDYINAIAQHRRRRGFDFWLISPHPSLIDVFIRRLISTPSWHRHLKRAFGADVVSELKFSAPDVKCEEPGAGTRGEVSMIAYPKEVYTWYRSASLHTGKKKIPKTVFVLAACAITVPLLGFYAFSTVKQNVTKKADPQATTAQATPGTGIKPPPSITQAPDPVAQQAMARDGYVLPRVPALPDFPHSAPIYAGVTAPKQAPYPAACVKMGDVCKCYTQQATRLHISDDVCLQIVRDGFFMDWADPNGSQQAQQQAPGARLVQHNGPDPRPPLPENVAVRSVPTPPPIHADERIAPMQVRRALGLNPPEIRNQTNK